MATGKEQSDAKPSSVAVWNSARRYLRYLQWLIPDSLLRFKAASALVLISGILGVAFQAQAFVIAIKYAEYFSNDSAVTVFARQYPIRESSPLLVVVGSGVLLSFLLSAYLIYFSRSRILLLSKSYTTFCTQRALQSSSSAGTSGESGLDKATALRLLTGDARICGRVLRMLLAMSIPAVTVLVCLAIALYLEPLVTVLVILVAPLYFFLQYRINQQSVHHSVLFERLGSQAMRQCKQALEDANRTNRNEKDDLSALVGRLFAPDGAVMKRQHAYFERLRVTESSRLVSQIFIAFVVAMILFVVGTSIMREAAGWGRLVIYMGALYYMMTSASAVFASIASMNRFYPQVLRYAHFVTGLAVDVPLNAEGALTRTKWPDEDSL